MQLQQSYGSADWSQWQKIRWTFYDYVSLKAAGDSQLTFFQLPVGQVDTNGPVNHTKTLEDTNMYQTANFGQVNFIIRQIRTHIRVYPKQRQASGISGQASVISFQYSALMNVLIDLQNQGVLVMNIGSKEYFDIPQPFITCPPGFGPDLDMHGANTGGTTQAFWTQQDESDQDVYVMDPQQLIEQTQTFQCTMQFANANYPATTTLVNSTSPLVQVGVLFDGYLLRPRQ